MVAVVGFLLITALVAGYGVYYLFKHYMETKENRPSLHNTWMQPENRKGVMERFGTTIKLVIVGFLTLILLIPLGMIESLIRERQSTKESAIADITSKWGNEQTITGPCLVVPYTETMVEDNKLLQVERNLLVLPETLSIKGKTNVEKRKRGIYDASVYGSDLALDGIFDLQVLQKSDVKPAQIQWDKLHILLGLSDLKGIKEKVILETNGKNIYFESGLAVENLAVGEGSGTNDNSDFELFSVGLNAKLDSSTCTASLTDKIPFKISLKMNGSQGLYVVPTGKTTTVNFSSDWATPSFDGSFLPEHRQITASGFTSEWKVLDLNRSYGQVIRADNDKAVSQMANSRFGVRFIQAVDQYQQNLRSVKYAILIVLLTFVVVFFIELIKKKSVNPFQYLLVGLALVLFYTLLLAMSEVWGFNMAYGVAAAMTTLLIALHMSSILKNRKQGMLIGALLAFLYLFIFILIQMESYALMVGSIGLFCILAVIMYYSRKLKI